MHFNMYRRYFYQIQMDEMEELKERIKIADRNYKEVEKLVEERQRRKLAKKGKKFKKVIEPPEI